MAGKYTQLGYHAATVSRQNYGARPTGGSADRQLRVWKETEDLKQVVDYVLDETEHGLPLDGVDTLTS